jgi:putative ABC transport system permease protein
MKKWLNVSIRDSRYAAKSLLRSPGFTLVAALTAALGIGANTAVFSMINAILLRPLNFPHPERLVNLKEIVPAFAHLYPILPVNGKHFHAWEQQCSSFESIALVDSGSVTLTGGFPPERVTSRAISWNYFHLLGVPSVAGRTFVPNENRPGENHVAMVTEELWKRRFGNDSLRQQTITVDGVPHVVIGILPSSFRVPEPQSEEEYQETPEIFTPLALDYAALPDMGDFNYQAIGRLRPGVSFQTVLSELNVVQAGVAKTAGLGTELKAAVQPLRDTVQPAAVVLRCGDCAAGGLREFGQPAAGASQLAYGRIFNPQRARRKPRAVVAPDTDGKPAFSSAGRIAGRGICISRAEFTGQLRPHERPPDKRGAA